MKSCPYCAQDETAKDEFGYCKVHDCFGQSGLRKELNWLISRAKKIWTMPDTTGQVSGPVSNFYSHRTRTANDIMYDAKKTFGFVPVEVLREIPVKNREPWDKNIRW